jgi:ketosteroid isomerase-like protein
VGTLLVLSLVTACTPPPSPAATAATAEPPGSPAPTIDTIETSRAEQSNMPRAEQNEAEQNEAEQTEAEQTEAEQTEAPTQKFLAPMAQREEPEKIDSKRTTTMKTPTELLRAYLANIRDPAAAAALFADDGVVELPAIHARVEGPAAIEKFIADLLEKVPDYRFQNIRIWIETADQTFGEYDVEALVPAAGKVYEQSYAGRLVAEDGKIKLLREWMDPAAASRAFASD